MASSIIRTARSFTPLRAMCVLKCHYILCRLTPMWQDCMIGLVFPAEGDARNFYKQVSNRKEIKRRPLVGFWQHPLILLSRSKGKGRSTRKEEEHSERRHHRQVSYLWPDRGIFRACRSYGLRCGERLHVFWCRPVLGCFPWRPSITWHR